MSRGLLIGGLALGGGALAWLAFREREAIGGAAVAVAETELRVAKAAVKAAKKGAIAVTDAAQTVWNKLVKLGLQSEASKNIAKYGIGSLLDKYLVDNPVPKWMAMAIIHTETGGTFDPLIYNYPYKSGKGGHDHAKQDPSNAYGEGWFKYNPHAIGLFQILQGYKKDYSRYGGFKQELSIRELLDAETNIRCGLGALKIHWQKRISKVSQASGAEKLAMLYFAHNQGGGFLDKGLGAAKNKLSARDVIKAAGAGMAGAPLTVALATASRGGLWEQLGALGESPA